VASPGEWASDWPLLSEARDRLDTIIEASATAAPDIIVGPVFIAATESVETRLIVQAFRDIISYGEVPVRAVRSDCGRLTPERVETLLAAASHTSFSFTSINQIDARFDSRQDRAIFGPRSTWSDIETHPPSAGELYIGFFDIQVYWPALVEALAAAGFSFEDAAADNATAQIEPGLPQSNETNDDEDDDVIVPVRQFKAALRAAGLSSEPSNAPARPPNASPAPQTGSEPITPAEWMQKHFRKDDKRDPAVRACMQATGSTWRVALEAYRQLPKELKRRRGEKVR
jgi:hypothetical protein